MARSRDVCHLARLLSHALATALNQNLASSRGAECLEKSGWYLAGTEDRLRESLTRSINQHLRPDKSGDSQSD